MVKQKTIEDPNKEIWLLRVPSSISLDAGQQPPDRKEQGDVGDIVARSKGAARDHGGPVGRAFGGDVCGEGGISIGRGLHAASGEKRGRVAAVRGRARVTAVVVGGGARPATTEMDAARWVPGHCCSGRRERLVQGSDWRGAAGQGLCREDGLRAPDLVAECLQRQAPAAGHQGALLPCNSTREPRDGSAPPGVVSSAPTKKRKSADASSENKKKKKKGVRAASPTGKKKKKKRRRRTAASYLPSMTLASTLVASTPRRRRKEKVEVSPAK